MKKLLGLAALSRFLATTIASSSAAEIFASAAAACNRGDYASVLDLIRPLADRGDAQAQLSLGCIYRYGVGVLRNCGSATKWYRMAADQGNAEAQFSLGFMYDTGEGVAQDCSVAVTWYRMAAEQGNAAAQLNLGTMYDSGDGVPQDYIMATKWYRKAAGQGSADAQFNLAIMYEKGLGVRKDDVQALKWFNLAAKRFPDSETKARDAAVKCRTLLAAKMTPTQVAKAEKQARDWKPKNSSVTVQPT